MIEPHLHCGECGREIATKLKVAGGKTKDVEVHAGTQFVLVASPEGLVPTPKRVPVCDDCHALITAQAERAASKLILPKTDLRSVQ